MEYFEGEIFESRVFQFLIVLKRLKIFHYFCSITVIFFRLNEGFTTFLERKIIGKLEGEKQRQFQAQCGWEVNYFYL